jgi:hypothetical protein
MMLDRLMLLLMLELVVLNHIWSRDVHRTLSIDGRCRSHRSHRIVCHRSRGREWISSQYLRMRRSREMNWLRPLRRGYRYHLAHLPMSLTLSRWDRCRRKSRRMYLISLTGRFDIDPLCHIGVGTGIGERTADSRHWSDIPVRSRYSRLCRNGRKTIEPLQMRRSRV